MSSPLPGPAAQTPSENLPLSGLPKKQTESKKSGAEIANIFKALLASVTDFNRRTIGALTSIGWTSPYKLLFATGQVNYGARRNEALKRIEPLGRPPFTEDEASVKAWRELEKSSPSPRRSITRLSQKS